MNALPVALPPVAADAAPIAPDAPPDPGESRRTVLRGRLASQFHEPTEKERAFVEIYATNGGNATTAYRAAYDVRGTSRHHAATAYHVLEKPGVQRYLAELRKIAADAASIDIQALLEADRAIVAAAEHAEKLTGYKVQCCRHCHGKRHLYQWRDDEEYTLALCAVMDFNATAPESKARGLPSDAGGYGFDPSVPPVPECTHCDGDGVQKPTIGDTSDLGLARPLYRGIKITKNGVEVLLHDVDKAKERLLRAAGAFGDDAASVARGAAAGAAIGASAAQAIANRAREMSGDELRKSYLTLVG